MNGLDRAASPEPAAGSAALAEVVRRLAEVYEPDGIYLFGSAARVDSGPDSNFDLLVVVPDGSAPARLRSRLGYEAFRGTGTAADVVVWEKSGFERRARVVTSLPATVLREGRLVYGG